MIRLKCHCGSEVEVSFSSTPAAYEKESSYAKDWMQTHECKFARGGLITAPPSHSNIIYTTHPPKTPESIKPLMPPQTIWCSTGSISVTTPPNTYVVNIGGDAKK